jgi:circadian clock protein KaiB
MSARVTIMTTTKAESATAAFEHALEEPGQPRYELRLYVTGLTPRSARAIANVKEICEEHLRGRYDLEVIDIYQQPVPTKEDEIIAVPTLIKKLPLPSRRMIGDLSDRARVLIGLDLKPKG